MTALDMAAMRERGRLAGTRKASARGSCSGDCGGAGFTRLQAVKKRPQLGLGLLGPPIPPAGERRNKSQRVKPKLPQLGRALRTRLEYLSRIEASHR